MKKQKALISLIIILFSLINLVNGIFPSGILTVLSTAFLVILLVLTFPTVQRGMRIILSVLLTIGIVIFIFKKTGYDVWTSAIRNNGKFVMLISLVPLFSIPFGFEDYQTELEKLIRSKLHNAFSFVVLVMIIMEVFSSVLQIASVMIVYSILAKYAELYDAEEPFIKTLSRGYGSSGFWSPAWTSIVIYSVYPDIKWSHLMPVGIAFAFIYICVHFLFMGIEFRCSPEKYKRVYLEESISIDKKMLFRMLAYIVLMIVCILVMDLSLDLQLIQVVCISSMILPVVIAICTRNTGKYKTGLVEYYCTQVPKVSKMVPLLVISGIFGKALSICDLGRTISAILPEWMMRYPDLMCIAILFLFTGMALVGVHPAATGTIFLATFAPATLGLPQYSYALAAVIGWLLATVVGPYSGLALMISSLTGKNNFRVSLGMNWLFVLVCILLFGILSSRVGALMA